MKLTDEEEALRAGAFGRAAQWAIEHQIEVGRYLGARDFVAVSQAHVMADTEALAAALTGRTPRYGYHLEERRRATLVVNVGFTPRELNDWGALGGIVGRLAGDYWQVPAIVGIERVPTSD